MFKPFDGYESKEPPSKVFAKIPHLKTKFLTGDKLSTYVNKFPYLEKYKYKGYVVFDRVKDWDIMSLTNLFTLKQRMSCPFGDQPYTPIQYKQLHPEQSWKQILSDKKIKKCTLYPIPQCVSILQFFGARRWLDPTAGWGDRLISAIGYGCEKYVGVDTNRSLFPSYNKIIKTFGGSQFNRFSVINSRFQDVDIGQQKFDLVFTSPPFFIKERYQNMNSWKDVIEFFNDFLVPLINKSAKHLEVGGHFVLYIEDDPEYEFIDIMKKYVEIDLKDELKYMGCLYYNGSKPRPYFVWQRI
jgi:hypothetical protein